MLVLRATRPRFGQVGSGELASIAVAVTGPGGVVVDGALEHGVEAYTTLIWRPALPFTPLTVYDVQITVDQSAAGSRCGAPAIIEVSGQVEVSDAPLSAAFIPAVEVEAELEVKPSYQYEDIVCCDGASPYVGSCVASDWGMCASIRGLQEIRATFTADRAALAAAGDQVALLGFDLVTGVIRRDSTDQAPCVVPTAIVHATGETISGAPICAGEALVAELGPVDIDANPDLASCMEPPQNCATADGGWDEAACERWDGWRGCGCRSDAGGEGALLLGLLAAARRRRRSSSAP